MELGLQVILRDKQAPHESGQAHVGMALNMWWERKVLVSRAPLSLSGKRGGQKEESTLVNDLSLVV